MTTYCAPCLADLALVREASTAVAGTASCMAHAVLLTHPSDDPQRRRQRLAQLRDNATEKLETAGPEERVRLEILVEEYGLASAMESLLPRRRPEEGAPTSRSARKRRGRDGRERPEGAPDGRGSHEGRGEGRRGPRPGGEGRPQGEPGAAEPAPGGAVADGTAAQQGADALAQVGAPSGEPPASVDAPSTSEAPPSTPEAPSSTSEASSAPDAPSTHDAPQAPSAPPAPDAPTSAPDAPRELAPDAPTSLAAETPAAPPAGAPSEGAPPDRPGDATPEA